MGIVIKTIENLGQYYVYDRSTNHVLRIDKNQYSELKKVETGTIPETQSAVVDEFKRKGFFLKNTLQEIEHPYTGMIKHVLDSHIEMLTLQVTQRCNLRCKYCTYSGKYDNYNRTHANYDMTWDVAQQAVDFYLQHSVAAETLNIGFYGGEPLLNLNLIKKTVHYIQNKVANRKVLFSLTTNATLLTLDTARYLFENGFSILISLDGSKEQHNQYRIFSDGSGSFDVIMKNLEIIKQEFPDDYKTLSFNAVINPGNDFNHLKNYFQRDKILGDADVMASIVDDFTPNSIELGHNFYRARAFEQFKLYLFMLNKLSVTEISKLVLLNAAEIEQRYRGLLNHRRLPRKSHHAGPCIPGAKRLFINVFGDLFPCERVGEKSPVMKIGTLEDGFDYDKIEELLNIGKISEENCKGCWAFHFCNLCCQQADKGKCLSKMKKLSYCAGAKENAYKELQELCVLREMGCAFNKGENGFYEKVGLSVDI